MIRDVIILSKHAEPDAQAAALEQGIVERCRSERRGCLVIPPLCHVAESSKLWKAIGEHLEHGVLLCWLHPRPARWLLHRHRIEMEESRVLDLRTFADADAAFAAVADLPDGAGDANVSGGVEVLKASTRSRWYPIIDQSRCVNCGHCLQFCLFGVYELDGDGRVYVQNPDQCKSGCPACARVCPQSAIMFPLYESDAAIAGAPGEFVKPDAAARRMFYVRTQQPCPACGRKADRKSSKTAEDAALCPECGSPLPKDVAASRGLSAALPADAKPAFDDLDLLVDQLDQAMQRRG
jgi:NAD-dependent dihydropyrimidine dehydrogenase PreA subunit